MSASPQIALITGAGSGIGRASALALLAAGYRVVLAGRRAAALEETAAAAGAAAVRALVVPTDITDPASVRALFAAIRAECGRLDFLFNNAGALGPVGPLEDVPFDAWQAAVATNLTGTFLCTQEAVRLMKEQQPRGGRIVNNGSVSAHVPRPHTAAYTATKHAITGLTRSTALDGRAFDIACGQIDIGNARSEMASHMTAGVRQANGTIAPEPLMDVRAVTDAILYLAALPLEASVPFLTVMATGMPYIGRG